MLERVYGKTEICGGEGAPGEVYRSDFRLIQDELVARYARRVQLCYFDPPYQTGQTFYKRYRVGEREWKSGAGSVLLPAYEDKQSREEYLQMMRDALITARALLTDSGLIFVHVDWRVSAHMRLLMDEVFGEKNFVNEIVWTYQTGGRAKRFFARKHDVILLYRKSSAFRLHMDAVAERRENGRQNHMKKFVDADGRAYRTIRSGGKIYTYYDDDPIAPGDVWDDVSHMQQKDPQRTGYDTQKPARLLERIIRCGSEPGDIVCDLFMGSGTTLAVASELGRGFVGCDQSPVAFSTTRMRLLKTQATFIAPDGAEGPTCEATWSTAIACHEVRLISFQNDALGEKLSGLTGVESWSVGYVRGDQFLSLAHAARSRQTPKLPQMLELPVLTGRMALLVCDAAGGRYVYALSSREDCHEKDAERRL